MAKVTLNTIIKFGSVSTESVLVDNSANFNTFDFPREQDLKDVTPFGSAARQFAVGLSNATFKGEAFWSIALDTQLNGLIGDITPVNFEYGPDGSTTGNPKYTGTMFIKSIGNPVKVGETKAIPVDFQITGTITRALY